MMAGHRPLVGRMAPPLGVGWLLAGVEGPCDSHGPTGQRGLAPLVAEGFPAQQEKG